MSRKALPIDVSEWTDKDQRRFDSKVAWVPATGCMVWKSTWNSGGYGCIKYRGRHLLAHRLAWVLEHGEPADGLELDHLCRVRSCVNTDHLEPVTSRENVRRGVGSAAIEATRTHCPHGHPYEPPNLRVCGVTGKRYCRACATRVNQERRLLINQAKGLLGLTRDQYTAIYGTSPGAAKQVINGTYNEGINHV